MVRNKTRFMVPCLSLLAPALLPSQETGSLRITVTDPSGAIVPDAQILLSDEFNGTRRIAAVDNDPSFCLVNGLDPGIYPLQVTKAGFDAYIVEKLRIHAREGQVVRIPLRLASAATQAITVTGEIEGVSSEPSAGTTVDGKYLSDLPVNSRGFESLLTLSRGVTNAGDGPDGGIHANGLRSNTNYYMVDGVSANTGVGGGGPALPACPGGPGGFGGSGANGTGVATNASGSSSGLISLDAVKELQVQVSAFAPEFGRSPDARSPSRAAEGRMSCTPRLPGSTAILRLTPTTGSIIRTAWAAEPSVWRTPRLRPAARFRKTRRSSRAESAERDLR